MSGGVSVNDALFHVGQHDLPFGGVGESGMGHYHGDEGFHTFSKLRPVFYQGRVPDAEVPDAALRQVRRPRAGLPDPLKARPGNGRRDPRPDTTSSKQARKEGDPESCDWPPGTSIRSPCACRSCWNGCRPTRSMYRAAGDQAHRRPVPARRDRGRGLAGAVLRAEDLQRRRAAVARAGHRRGAQHPGFRRWSGARDRRHGGRRARHRRLFPQRPGTGQRQVRLQDALAGRPARLGARRTGAPSRNWC